MRSFYWIGVTAATLWLALFLAACGSEERLLTGSSLPQSRPGSDVTLSMSQPSSHHGGSDDGSSDDDRSGDDDSDDDESKDDPSEDDPSEDDPSEDGPNGDNSGSEGGGDEARVRGLLFALGDCGAAVAPPCTLVIGSTPVSITDDARLDVEPLDLEEVSFLQFASSLTELGLPLKAVGDGEDPVIATRVRIDDELAARGVVSGPDSSGVFTMIVNGDASAPVIHFRLAAGVRAPGAGLVRIEARVPADLSPPIVYEAFEVEN